jgi:tRNA (adenine22-N1)-methyltransferase
MTGLGRFEALAAFVPRGAALLDIGTDHGLLPRVLLRQGEGRVRRCIASDVHQEPLAGARAALAAEGFAERCELRLGDGLDVLGPHDEVDVVSCAGLGGATMARILERGFGPGGVFEDRGVHALRRLVLQPFAHAPRLRETLARLGFGIVDERAERVRGRLVVTIVAEPGAAPAGASAIPSAVATHVGPILAQDPDARALVADELRVQLRAAERALARAGDRAGEALVRGITTLRDVLAWCGRQSARW